MNNLVQVETTDTFTTTLIIAEGVKLEHRAVIQLLDRHLVDLESLGGRPIEWAKKRENRQGKPTRHAKLNFKQAMYLVSLMSNSARLLKLKSAMIEFGDSVMIADIIDSFDVSEVPDDKYVYVAREAESNRYKIGISKDPERRVKELNIGNPEQLILVHAYLALELRHKSETLAHKTFTNERLRSEWFDKNINLNLLPSYQGD